MSLLLLLLTTWSVLGRGQSEPELTFHFVAPGTGRVPETLDVGIEQQMDHQFFKSMCRSIGNEVTLRVSLVDGSIHFLDENSGLSNLTDGAMSCLPVGVSNPIKCTESSFCNQESDCTATLVSVCPKHGASTTWMMTQNVDVTLSVVGDDLVISRCYAMCENSYQQHVQGDEDESGISNLALGLIIAGVILGAFLLVIGVIFWKFKDQSMISRSVEKLYQSRSVESVQAQKSKREDSIKVITSKS
ncbi:unnamed protein product [Lymnaea stagnalis]|uniref:Uncharacterized protein n=1 Tax=Lymnaea stagnalis TaxID=6523 RepID=A0AAV2H540_LYMST